MQNFVLGLLTEVLAEPLVALLFLVVLPGGSVLLTFRERSAQNIRISWARVVVALLFYLSIGVAVFWGLSTELIGNEPTYGIYLSRMETTPAPKTTVVTPEVSGVSPLPDWLIPLWPTVTPTSTVTHAIEPFSVSVPTETFTPKPISDVAIVATPTLPAVPDVHASCFDSSLRITKIEPNAQTIDARVIQDIHIWGGAHNTTEFSFDTFYVEAKKQHERPMLDHIQRWDLIIAEFPEQRGVGAIDQLLATWQYDKWQLLFDEAQNEVVVWIRVAGVNSQGNGRSMESDCFVKLRLTR